MSEEKPVTNDTNEPIIDTTPVETTPIDNEATFWTRVSSFPLVQDASQKVQDLANQNSISRYALEQAGSTLNRASSLATPYTETYMKKADALGCRSLDMLEQRFPVVKTPTEDLIQAVKQSPQQVLAPVNKTMLTAAGNLETLVDKLLPPATTDDKRQEQVETVATAKFYSLANSVKDRLQVRVTQQLDQIPRNTSDITRLAETNQLLKDTVDHIQNINTQLQQWVVVSRNTAGTRVQGLKDNIKGGYEATQQATNQRLYDLTVELFHHLDSASVFLKEHSVKLPAPVQTHLSPLAKFASGEYDIIRTEALKEDVAPLQKATNILQLSHEYIVPFLQTSVEGIQQQLQHYASLPINAVKPAATPAVPEPTTA
ncbi:hypothetical protein DM01DRAFT_1405074 [Hesseltinella vesiculosa]|uniref:Lipid droplet-associated perilipin protein n=1 Tax=Hesseltinella vesiculosa TaxID=101127 RepID=A0A1X2GR63_9FUNG|nr:hypothetical protein DM01DRAFT_1405074 [Hesseltinella vesiculosa]